MPQRGAHEQHPQHGGEGKAPHRAEAFVAMKRKEDTSQSATTRHAKGMTTGPDQKAPEDNQGGREGGGSRRERAKPQAPKPPDQTKKRRQQHHQNHRTAATKGRSPAAPRKKPHEKRTGNGQPKQGHPRQARDARPRGTDPNRPHKTLHKRIREDEHTCPVCGQTHPHSKPKLEAEVVKVRAKL